MVLGGGGAGGGGGGGGGREREREWRKGRREREGLPYSMELSATTATNHYILAVFNLPTRSP